MEGGKGFVFDLGFMKFEARNSEKVIDIMYVISVYGRLAFMMMM